MSTQATPEPDPELEPIVPKEIEEEYLRIRSTPKTGIAESKVFYFKEVIQHIRPRLEAWPEHVRLRSMGYTTLVSLMGFSPETTVLSTLVLRPKTLVIVYSENARESARPALAYLEREGLIDTFDRELISVNAYDPGDIYAKIRDALTPTDGMIFDITGGTKVMSATAGALAWELNLSLCYLEGGWDPNQGSADTKKLSKMTAIPNPSKSRGFQIRKEALGNYDRGNFPAAAEGFEGSGALIDPHPRVREADRGG